MRIVIEFQFNDLDRPSAVTGVEGDVSDVLLPMVGDLISHSDAGQPFTGRVTGRHFSYMFPEGVAIDGTVTITLSLDRVLVH